VLIRKSSFECPPPYINWEPWMIKEWVFPFEEMTVPEVMTQAGFLNMAKFKILQHLHQEE